MVQGKLPHASVTIMSERLDLPGAQVTWMPGWLPPAQADALLAALKTQLNWEVHRIRMFGREVDSPRLSCWIGDPQARYRYSGTLFDPHPWPGVLLPVRDQLRQATATTFNSVLANCYRDGHDAMGWHSDDEKELGPQPLIASLSLGGERRFALRHRQDPALRRTWVLGHGDLLLMGGDTQRNYRHALPRTARPVAERINLTFRRILV